MDGGWIRWRAAVAMLGALAACASTDGEDAVDTDGGDSEVVDTTEVRDPPIAPNVLLVLLDDVGRDAVAAYGLHPDAPPTPTLDGLAASGVRFTNAWASPECSPTRAALLTGRYARRTGVGIAYSPHGATPGLGLDELTIPEALALAPEPWASAALGKWHLGTDATGGVDNPTLQGFETFRGTVGNLTDGHTTDGTEQDYYHWQKVEDGELRWVDRYATTETVDDAVTLTGTLPEPWFVYLAFHAAHKPFDVPPLDLDRTGVGPRAGDPALFRAIVSAVDTELGRLLDGMPAALRERTVVIVLGDNGSPATATTPPFPSDMSKKSVYEAGVGVPFIVSGPVVLAPGEVCDAPVSMVDVMPTVLELAGIASDDPGLPVLDGMSLVPWLTDPGAPWGRPVLYGELFAPNGVDRPRPVNDRVVSDGRWKLVVHAMAPDELYDMTGLIVEGDDLLAQGALTDEAQAAYDALWAALLAQEEAFGGLR